MVIKKSSLNLEEVDGEHKEILNLLEIRYWRNRLGFDHKIVSILILILFIIQQSASYILNPKILTNGTLIREILYLSIIFYASYLIRIIPERFERGITENSTILTKEEEGVDDIDYKMYNQYVKYSMAVFSQKVEKWITPLTGIVMFFIQLYYFGGKTHWFQGDVIGGTFYLYNSWDRILLLSSFLVGSALLSILAMLLTSFICVIFFMFDAMNQLGKDEFSLDISYFDLKSESLNNLGKNILEINIPILFGLSLVSVLGLLNIYLFKEGVIGMSFVLMGTMGIIIFTVLMYLNMTNVHGAIINFKTGMIQDILLSIQNELSKKSEADFVKIHYMQELSDAIRDVSDWPFNPASIKKLSLTLLSTFTPIFLSLLQINNVDVDWSFLL